MKKFLLYSSIFYWSASFVQAKIYIDHEEEPLPVVTVQVVIPQGYALSASGPEAASHLVLSDIVESGTQKLSKQKFIDQLSEYAADYSFSVGREHSSWDLEFLWDAHKNYEGLTQVLKENWQQPRFDKASVETAKLKYESALRAELDHDSSLAVNAVRRSIHKNNFGGFPVFLEDIQTISPAGVSSVYKNFLEVSDIWVGILGPKEAVKSVEGMIQSIFSRQGSVEEGMLKQPLKTKEATYRPTASTPQKTIYLISKPDRQQMVFSLSALSRERLDRSKWKDMLTQDIANYVLVGAGLGSRLNEEIRSKRGLAYSIGAVEAGYMDHAQMGFMSNPQRNRAPEMLELLADIEKNGLRQGQLFKAVDQSTFDEHILSFQYGEVMERSTAGGRLARRKEVVTDDEPLGIYELPIHELRTSKDAAEKSVRDHWQSSDEWLSLVGDEKELRPLLQKYFPDFQLKVIPYKECTSRKVQSYY